MASESSSGPITGGLDGAVRSFMSSPAARDGTLEQLNRVFIDQTRIWIRSYGHSALDAWYEQNSGHMQSNRLVHVAAAKNLGTYITFLANEGMDVNPRRNSDGATPMHLALRSKRATAVEALKDAGADLSIADSTGENCIEKYEAFEKSCSNLIFLDLEMTHAFYDWARIARETELEPTAASSGTASASCGAGGGGKPASSADPGSNSCGNEAATSSGTSRRGGTTVTDPSRILEAAVIITDKDLNELERGQWVVGGFTREDLEALPEFHQKNFRDPVIHDSDNAGGDNDYDSNAEMPSASQNPCDAGSMSADNTGFTENGSNGYWGKSNSYASGYGGSSPSSPSNLKRRKLQFPPLNTGDDDKYAWYGGNGLFSDVMDQDKAKPLHVVQKELLEIITRHCPEGTCGLAGCSVGNDRELLRFQMPQVYAHLSHRVVDCSTVLGGMVEAWCPDVRNHEELGLLAFKRKQYPNVRYTHRALDDCESAIIMMRWLRERFFSPQLPNLMMN